MANYLRIRIANDPTTLDPRKSSDFISATLVCLLYEGLTRYLPDGGVEMGVANSVEISENGKKYVFHLRKTYWSDGFPVTAYDFEKTWKQVLDPNQPSVCSYLFYHILHAEKVICGEKNLEEVGIRAIDESTLEILLERPTPYFLSLTAFPNFLPIPQHRTGPIDHSSNEWISNGPFVLDRMTSHSILSLRKNQSFWRADTTRLEGIAFFIIPNDMTALEMFERKELDWLGGYICPIPSEALPFLQERLRYFPMTASTFCTFNTQCVPFSNKNIRKAFNFATNREEIAKEINPVQQIFAGRYIPPALCDGKNKVLFPPFDPRKAKEHLEKGLLELGKKNLSVTIRYRNGMSDEKLVQILKEMWETSLGVKVNLLQSDQKTHKESLHKRTYEIAIASWIAQYPDRLNILERFKSKSNAKNYCAWENQEFVHLLELSQETEDMHKRIELLETAEEILAEETPIVPLYHWSQPSLTNPRLRNVHATPSGGILFERCWLMDELDLSNNTR